MKRIVVLLAILLLSFGLTQAANQVDIDVPMIQDSLRIDAATTLDIYLENDLVLGGMSLGFQVWSPGTATWQWDNVGGLGTNTGCVTVVAGSRLDPAVGTGSFDMTGLLITEQNIDEAGRDTIMAGGVAMMKGLPTGPLDHLYSYNFIPGNTAGGDAANVAMLCFDSCFVPPSGAFVFVDGGGNAFPPTVLWDYGTKCYPVTGMRNACPEFTTTTAAADVSHGGTKSVTLNATDLEGNAISFSLVSSSGAGTATVTGSGGTATVTYVASNSEVGAVEVVVGVTDAFHNASDCGTATVTFNVTNNAPTINCGNTTDNPVGFGNTITKTIAGADTDACDALEYAIVSGPGDIDMATGVYTWATTLGDVGDHTVCVSVTDGFDVAECCFDIQVLLTEPFEVQLEKTHGTLQGHYVDVDITANKGSEAMGGFDFLIGYDASALAFTEAALSDELVACGWEYFTYRYNWNGNCGNGCPSGLVRLVGLAETNNGASHPDFECINNAATIATLTFYVSNDRTLECMYVPIRFYWMDCGDNTISVASGDTLAINRFIYDLNMNELQDYTYGLPGWVGAPNDPCMDGDKVTPVRFIDFVNGGIDIVCSDSIDARGDVNVNGVANEIADAVMFTNYFITGLSAFGGHMEASIAASDVNADGIVLSVADLVYLVRVIVGDANPYPKPIPNADVQFTMTGDRVTYNSSVDMGAALLTFQVNGDVTPVLGAGAASMDMKYAREGNELRVLVYNIGSEMIAAGENVLVTVPGAELTGAEVATYDGFGLNSFVRNVPKDFALTNYPNPFNPTTTISLSLPVASDWSVKIYNVAGQLVKDYTGFADAGRVNVVWNGTDNNGSSVASGIYFYKAEAGKFTATKKMVLMK